MLSNGIKICNVFFKRLVLAVSILVLLLASNAPLVTALPSITSNLSTTQQKDFISRINTDEKGHVLSPTTIDLEENDYVEVTEENEDLNTTYFFTCEQRIFCLAEKSLFPTSESKRPIKKFSILLYVLHHSWKSDLV